MATHPVYLEIVDFFAAGTTPQAVIDFHPSPEAQERALALLELAKQDHLTPEQESELDHVISRKHGGETQAENLVFACYCVTGIKVAISLRSIRQRIHWSASFILVRTTGRSIFGLSGRFSNV